MNTVKRRRLLRAAGVLIALNLMLAAFTNLLPFSSYLTSFSIRYPASTSDNSASCQLCHGSTNGFLNGYGRAVQLRLNAGDSITAALAAVESLNSDSDPTGSSNLVEINANTQPGWTPGANTVYNTGSGATSTQTAPTTIGTLDPAPPSVPDINVTPLSLDFGAVTVATSKTMTTAVQNTGTATLSVTGLSTTGSSGFSVDAATPARPFTVPAGGSVNVTVRYTPGGVGSASGQLLIASNDPDEASVSVSLSGSGTPPAGTCDIDVTPLSLNFGSVVSGQNATLSVSVGNTGTATCTVNSRTVAGSDFSLGAGAPATPFQVAPGAFVGIPVRYAPSDLGSDSGTLVIGSDDPDEASVTVVLSGTGVAPPACDIGLSAASLSFGSVQTGSSATMSLQLTNAGTAACSVTALAVTSANFSLGAGAPALPAQISVGNSISVPVRYQPSAPGAHSGNLAITSNDPQDPVINVPLSGTGIPPAGVCDISIDQSSIDFGSVAVGSTATRSVALGNTGAAACTVTSLTVNGSAFSLGSAAPATPFPVPPSGVVNVQLTFTPAAGGSHAGSLTIANSDVDESNLLVALSGSGVAPTPCNIAVSPSTLNFGAVPVGTTVTRSTTVSNTSQSNCTLNALTLQGTSEFALRAPAPVLPYSLVPGESVPVQVDYKPTGLGDDAGTLRIGSSDPNQPVIAVSLTASGVQVPPACNIEVSPLSLDFGSVQVGESAALTSTVRNTGTGSCSVSWNLAAGTSANFKLTPAGAAMPANLPPGAVMAVSVAYEPAGAGDDAGALAITSNDPGKPSVSVSLAGKGFQPRSGIDLSIVRFRVTEHVVLQSNTRSDRKSDVEKSERATRSNADGRESKEREDEVRREDSQSSQSVSMTLVIENLSETSEPRKATLVGIQGGQEVYNHSLMVSAKANNGRGTFQFPSYAPTVAGELHWTVVVHDDFPDVDKATASTEVKRAKGKSDD